MSESNWWQAGAKPVESSASEGEWWKAGAKSVEPKRTLGGTIKDMGVTALKGAVGLPQAVVGLADMATGGHAGKALEGAGLRFKETQDILSDQYSDAQKAANRKVAEADGFVGTAKAMLENPSTIATSVGESLPQMLGGAGVARELLKVAPKVGVAIQSQSQSTSGANLGRQTDQTQQASPARAPQAGAAASAGASRPGAAAGQPSGGMAGASVPPASAAAVGERHPSWRTNALQAGRIARSLGLDPKGKRVAQIVAEIDAADAQRGGQAQADGLDAGAVRFVRQGDFWELHGVARAGDCQGAGRGYH